MEELNFHLDGIVRTKNEQTDFDGPLELILQLLSRNKVEIKDIKISLILEQYLAYLDRMKRMDLEIASEFLEMASYLTYIKAKSLLVGEEQVEEMDELKNSLEELSRKKEYERIKLMADRLAPLAGRGEGIFTKQPEPLSKEKGYRYSHSVTELLSAMKRMLGREAEAAALPEGFTVPARLVYPIGEKSEEIMGKLKQRHKMTVKELFHGASGRSELVASFIAVLELCRSGNISLEEENGEFVAEAAS